MFVNRADLGFLLGALGGGAWYGWEGLLTAVESVRAQGAVWRGLLERRSFMPMQGSS